MKSELPELLRHASRQSVQDYYIGSVNGSDIYQVPQDWQKAVLQADADVAVAEDAERFEAAVAAPDVSSIFVPMRAGLSQELAERILQRHPLANTIYWEVE